MSTKLTNGDLVDHTPASRDRYVDLLRAAIGDREGVEIRCNDPSACPGGRFAYARERDLVLGVCPPFFRARMGYRPVISA